MKAKVTTILIVLMFAVLTKAEFEMDDDNIRYYLLLGNGRNRGQNSQCSPYGGACSSVVPCCQYLNRGQFKCFSGQCLQAQCGYPGQQCGNNIGECCYHLGLICTSVNWFWSTCQTFSTSPSSASSLSPPAPPPQSEASVAISTTKVECNRLSPPSPPPPPSESSSSVAISTPKVDYNRLSPPPPPPQSESSSSAAISTTNVGCNRSPKPTTSCGSGKL